MEYLKINTQMILTPKQNSINIKHFGVSLDGSPLPLQFFTIFLQVNKKQTLEKKNTPSI